MFQNRVFPHLHKLHGINLVTLYILGRVIGNHLQNKRFTIFFSSATLDAEKYQKYANSLANGLTDGRATAQIVKTQVYESVANFLSKQQPVIRLGIERNQHGQMQFSFQLHFNVNPQQLQMDFSNASTQCVLEIANYNNHNVAALPRNSYIA